ncbi:MAG: hypothetical protein WC375_05015 [Methanomassiliicoccales archaeon]|jgi:hypothetical protein
MEVYTMFEVPEDIIPEVRKKYSDEKNTDFEVDKAHPSTTPYYAFGDPRATPDKITFNGNEYWVYRTSPGVKMNWCYDHA